MTNSTPDSPTKEEAKMTPKKDSPVAIEVNEGAATLATAESDDGTKVEIKKPSGEVEDGLLKSKEDLAKEEDAFRALTKAELMKYATDPFWVTLRWVLFILFWVAWVAMLVAAIIIIVLAPKCPTPAPKAWWQKAPIYEVYVKSFKDSNGDGIGDLQGIQQKLDYFESLGVGSLWLTPIYPSPMKDNGYDIKDYNDVDPMFGNLEDFKKLLAGMKDKGLKLILDFVPNHSSKEHEWFKKSVAKEEPYTDFYIWKQPKAGGPPNNWKSVFGGSAWTLDETRGEYYLHQFYPAQPDLNLANPKVVTLLKEVLSFWLDLGVDGFRIDAAGHFFESESMEDEPFKAGKSGDAYDDLDHIHTFNLPKNIDLLAEFRQVLDNKTAEDVYNPRIMMTEVYLDLAGMTKYYGDARVIEAEHDDLSERSTISQMPLNFGLITEFKNQGDLTADKVRDALQNYLDGLPDWAWPNFQLGNHDVGRVASRLGSDLVDAMNMIYMLLPGTPVTYYGEELGMVDANLASPTDKRDPARTPMQWSAEANAGFTSANATPWLAVNPDYTTLNADTQLKKSEVHTLNSHAAIYSYLANLRLNEAILFGSTEFFNGTTNGHDVFGYVRVKKGNPGTLVLVNFGVEDVTADLSMMKYLPDRGTVQVRSVYDPETYVDEGKTISFKELKIKPKEGLVIAFVPKFN